MRQDMNIREATQYWVRGFNAIPQDLIEKTYGGDNIDSLVELTPISEGDRVWSYDYNDAFYVVSTDREDGAAIIKVEGEEVEVQITELCNENENGLLPMWGTMWTFEERMDSDWAEENLHVMADCGFRIYESDELGIYFGIDGAGYDFYENHWIPLYKARGLKWHSEEAA